MLFGFTITDASQFNLNLDISLMRVYIQELPLCNVKENATPVM